MAQYGLLVQGNIYSQDSFKLWTLGLPFWLYTSIFTQHYSLEVMEKIVLKVL